MSDDFNTFIEHEKQKGGDCHMAYVEKAPEEM